MTRPTQPPRGNTHPVVHIDDTGWSAGQPPFRGPTRIVDRLSELLTATPLLDLPIVGCFPPDEELKDLRGSVEPGTLDIPG